MKKRLFAIILTALACAAVGAQNHPAKTLKEARGIPASPVTETMPAAVPAACNPCLWYSGDSDPNNPLDNSTWNGYSPEYCGIGLECSGQIWVPFAPTSDGNLQHKHVNVTSVTFNEWIGDEPTDLDGGTYQFNTFVSSGNGGIEFQKPTNCKSMTAAPTARSGEYSLTCVLHKPIKLGIGINYWVNILPTFTQGNTAYIDDVEDIPAPNQMGWGNIYYNSYASGPIYYPGWYVTEQVCTVGCDAFSVAIAGTYVP